MKHLKKYMAALAAAVLLWLAPWQCPGRSAFTSVQKVAKTVTASITVGGTRRRSALPVLWFSTWSGNNGHSIRSGLGYSHSRVRLDSVSDQYIQIDSTLTVAGSGIQTYTDNTNATANPRYSTVPSSTTPSPAGLINTATPSAAPMPTAWRIVGGTSTTGGITGSDPNNIALLLLISGICVVLSTRTMAQVAVPSLNAGAFITVPPSPMKLPTSAPGTILGGQTSASPGGIHFAQAPTSFGGFVPATSTTDIYTGSGLLRTLRRPRRTEPVDVCRWRCFLAIKVIPTPRRGRS